MYNGEYVNSISHVVGAALALMGLGGLLAVSVLNGNPWMITSFTVFGSSMVILYTMSALYHSLKPSAVKHVFQKLDHVAIYLLIAGTYTPITLVTMREHGGWWMFGVVWGLAVIGVLIDTLPKKRKSVLSMLIYLGMGWACIMDYNNLIEHMPSQAMNWIIAGGTTYTAGVIFYILDSTKNMPFAHGIWHFFVLGGSICHYIGIVGYIR